MLCPSFRESKHTITKIGLDNYKRVSEDIQTSIMLYFSMDYKILKKTNNYLKRKMQYSINNDGTLFRYEFLIDPDIVGEKIKRQENQFDAEKQLLDESILKEGHPFLNNQSLIRENISNSQEDSFSRKNHILSPFYDLSILISVLRGFSGIKMIRNFDKFTSLIILYFGTECYQFIRIESPNCLIFQSNDEHSSDFIVFRVVNNVFYIYQYGIKDKLVINSRTVEAIIKIMRPGSYTKLPKRCLKLLNPLCNTTGNYEMVYTDSSIYYGLEVEPSDINVIFTRIKHNYTTDLCAFNLFTIDISASLEELQDILEKTVCRFLLIFDEVNVIASRKIGHNIITSIIASNEENHNDLIVHSLIEDKLIIDTVNEDFVNSIIIELKLAGSKTRLSIHSETRINRINLSNFKSNLLLLVRHRGIGKIAAKESFKLLDNAMSYNNTYMCEKGALYIEIDSAAEHHFYFSALKRGGGLLSERICLAGSSRSKFVMGTEKEDLVTVSINSSVRLNVSLKVLQLDRSYSYDQLLSCDVLLKPKKHLIFEMPVYGRSSIFWQNLKNPEIKSTLHVGIRSIDLSNSGCIPSGGSPHTFKFRSMSNFNNQHRIYLGTSLIE